MSRSAGAVLGLLVIAIGGVVAYRRYETMQRSPFPLWEIRAGMPFATLDDQAQRGAHKRFSCRPVEADVRLCELEADGPTGLMRLALDNTGRAMIVQFRVTDTTLKMSEEARKLGAEWSLVDARHPQRKSTGGASITRWASADNSWSASMSNGASSSIPSMIVLVDERRLTRTVNASAPVLLRLARAGFIDAEVVDAAVAHSTTDVAAGARTLGAPGRALSATALALPRCEFQPGDSVVSGRDLRTAFGSDESAVLEQAMVRAYPGMRLRLERVAYLVDAAGAAEEIRLVGPTWDENAFAFAVTFPRRVSAVHGRLEAFGDMTGQCRAAAEIIIGRRDSASGKVVDVRRHDLDEDALAHWITALDFTRDVDGRAVLVAKYSATYGTPDWIGEIDWDALVVPSADSLRVERRVPNVFGKKDHGQHETAGMLIVDKESPAGMHLLVMEGSAEALIKLLVLPPGPRGLPSGWVLLDLL
jgi:hypothetical protein